MLEPLRFPVAGAVLSNSLRARVHAHHARGQMGAYIHENCQAYLLMGAEGEVAVAQLNPSRFGCSRANAFLMLTACAFGHVVCDGPARLYRPALACHSPFPPAIFASVFC